MTSGQLPLFVEVDGLHLPYRLRVRRDFTNILPIFEFRWWLAKFKALHHLTNKELGRRIGVNETRVRYWLKSTSAHGIADRTVERVGIALLGDPRLAQRLYPVLAS